MSQAATLTAAAPWGSAEAAPGPKVAVLVPCHDEGSTGGAVVDAFRRTLPAAEIARRAGATVRTEGRQGEGNVVRRMLADGDAECHVMVDGDDTYAAVRGVGLVAREGHDFVNIARATAAAEAYRPGYRFGHAMLTGIVPAFFGRQTSGMLSGYEVLSRRFVRSSPAMSRGFETETERTVPALEMHVPMAEFPAPYRERPAGSTRKLRTFRDGWRSLLLLAGLLLGLPIVSEYVRTGLVPRLPTAGLSVGFIVPAALSALAGLILDVVTKARQELKRLACLSSPRP